MRFLENKIPNSTAPKIVPVREYDMPDQETEMDKKILRMLNEFIAEGNALKALVEEDIYVRLGATIQAVEDLQLESAMPYQFINLKTGKKYRYSRQVSVDGIPQIISEEVV